MAKKFYDIFPPEIKKEEQVNIPLEKKEIKTVKKFNFNFNFKKILISSVVLFLFFIVASHTFLLNAQVIIHPVTERVSYSGEFKIDLSLIDFQENSSVIPGEIFELKKEHSRNFHSSGMEMEEKKSQGVLTVYNDHSSSPQILVANTRFISSDGKLFYSLERVSVPGRTEDGRRTIPGEINVTVVAAEAGEDYNINKTSKFSIPGLQGTPMYTSVYAENPEPITGGYVGELPKITQEDVNLAKEIVVQDIIDEAKEKLKKEISSDFVIDKQLINYQITEEFIYPNVGENSELFDYSIKVDFKILSYKKSDKEKMVRNFLLSQVSLTTDDIFSVKEIDKKSLRVSLDIQDIDLDKGEVKVIIECSALSYLTAQENHLKEFLSGKNFKQVKNEMESYSNIEKVNFNYWPFWINSLPSPNNIKIKINIEN